MAEVAKKIAGVDVLLQVKGSDNKLITIGGQTGASLSRTAETIDVTDKSSGGWGSSMAGLKSFSISCDGFVVLGDAGQDALDTAFENRTPIQCSIRVGASNEAVGKTYNASVYITDYSLDFAQDNAVTYTLELVGASPLVVTKGSVTTS